MWSLRIAASWPVCHVCLFVLLLIFDLSKRQTKAVGYANLWNCSQPNSGNEKYREFKPRKGFLVPPLLTMDYSMPVHESKPCLVCLRFSYLRVTFYHYFRHQNRFLLVCFQLDKHDSCCLFLGTFFIQLSGFVVWYVHRDKNRTKKVI